MNGPANTPDPGQLCGSRQLIPAADLRPAIQTQVYLVDTCGATQGHQIGLVKQRWTGQQSAYPQPRYSKAGVVRRNCFRAEKTLRE